jgi:hypothetical protein
MMTINVHSKIATDVKDFFQKTESMSKRYVYEPDAKYFSEAKRNIDYWSNWECFINRAEFYFNGVKYKILHKCDESFHYYGNIYLTTESHIWKQIIDAVCENYYPENKEACKLERWLDGGDYSVEDFWNILNRKSYFYSEEFSKRLKGSIGKDKQLEIVL